MSQISHCAFCLSPLAQPARGRRRQYCSHACRQRGWRLRRLGHIPQPDRDRVRWDQADRRAELRLRQWERRFGPFSDQPDPDAGLSFRWRILFRLRRDMPIPFCRWCGRPYIPEGGPGSIVHCCSEACRRHLRDFRSRLDSALHQHHRVMDGRVYVRLRLNDPRVQPYAPPLPRVVGLCAHCGVPFPRYLARRKYCSKRCRQAAYRSARRACRVCHRKFVPNPRAVRPQKYCSRRCRGLAARPLIPAPPHRRCPECGQPFTPDKRNAHKQVYCSKPCRMRRTRRVPPLALVRDCAECGDPFPVDQRNRAKNIYCSRRCFDRAYARARRRARKINPYHLVRKGREAPKTLESEVYS